MEKELRESAKELVDASKLFDETLGSNWMTTARAQWLVAIDHVEAALSQGEGPAEDQNCPRCGFPWSEHHGDKHAQGYICPKPSAAKERKG